VKSKQVRAEICNSCIKLSLFYFSLFLFIFNLLLSNLVTWSFCWVSWSRGLGAVLFSSLVSVPGKVGQVAPTFVFCDNRTSGFYSSCFPPIEAILSSILPVVRNQFPSRLFELDRLPEIVPLIYGDKGPTSLFKLLEYTIWSELLFSGC